MNKILKLQPYEVILWGHDRDRPLWKVMVNAFSSDEAREAALGQYQNNPQWIVSPTPKIERVEVLDGIHLDHTKRQQSLFEDLADLCVGAKLEDIQGACVNLLLTSVQRRYLTLGEAETRWDELMGRGKQALKRRMSSGHDYRDTSAETELGMKLIG